MRQQGGHADVGVRRECVIGWPGARGAGRQMIGLHGAPNPGAESGCRIRVPNPGAESDPVAACHGKSAV